MLTLMGETKTGLNAFVSELLHDLADGFSLRVVVWRESLPAADGHDSGLCRVRCELAWPSTGKAKGLTEDSA